MKINCISDEKRFKQKAISILTHLIGIFIFIFLPEIIMKIGSPHHNSIPTGVYVRSLIYIIAFYINYFFLFGKCIDNRHGQWKFIFYNIIILIFSILILYVVWDFTAADKPIHAFDGPYLSPPPPEEVLQYPGELPYIIRSIGNFIRDGVILIFIIGLSVAIKLSQHTLKIQQYKQSLIATQREEELNRLKCQLNPHFLFNTLNSIYALIDISQSKAKKAIHELSHMLRYMLYENPETVELISELDFIKNYIALMKLRLGDTIPVNATIDTGNSEKVKIAPLIFITIIENAFKHGNTGNPTQAIDISIIAKDGYVTCHTFNYFNSKKQSQNNGIGLRNLRRRLALIYKEKAQLSFHQTENTFTVDLHINLNP